MLTCRHSKGRKSTTDHFYISNSFSRFHKSHNCTNYRRSPRVISQACTISVNVSLEILKDWGERTKGLNGPRHYLAGLSLFVYEYTKYLRVKGFTHNSCVSYQATCKQNVDVFSLQRERGHSRYSISRGNHSSRPLVCQAMVSTSRCIKSTSSQNFVSAQRRSRELAFSRRWGNRCMRTDCSMLFCQHHVWYCKS